MSNFTPRTRYQRVLSSAIMFFAGLLLLLAGCTKTVEHSPPSSDLLSEKNLIYVFDDYSLPTSVAANRAQSYFQKTKSGETAKIKQIAYITSANPNAPATKSADSGQIDTVMYVINFENNAGFIILTADYRTDPIVAMSEEGNFNTETPNPTVRFVMERAKAAYWEQIDKFEREKANLGNTELNRLKNKYKHLKLYNKTLAAAADPGEPGGGGIGGGGGETPPPTEEPEEESDPDGLLPPPPPPPAETYYNEDKIIPLYTKYNQTFPFNNEAPLINEQRAYAGCVAVAMAQVMAYHGHPTTVSGRSLNWTIMNISNYSPYFQYAIGDIAYLLRKIGDKLNNSWGIDPEEGTLASIVKIGPALNDYGYVMNTGYWQTDTPLIFSIDNNWPVLCHGDLSSGDGHVWVLDGYRWAHRSGYGWFWDEQLQEYRPGLPYKYSSFYVRCNWGWGGSWDGYYSRVYLNPSSYYFYKNLYLISSIRPKN